MLDSMYTRKDQISARLSRAKTELEEALLEIERLPVFEAGNVVFAAHALNNFLTVTNATASLLRLQLMDHPNPELHTLLEGLLHTTDLMAYTLGRLMNTTARSDTVLAFQDVDLVKFTQRARDFYQRIAADKQIKINFETVLPSAVAWTDNVAVGAILDNLISNAIKYSPPGKQIWIRINGEPDSVVCSVRDEGPGLSFEDQARLFQRGVRLSAVPTGGEPSTGYGLAVAKELITRLGGSIWCNSQPGAGACFSFRLPAPGPAESNTAPATHAN
jgi:signal transduction histidine kinase